MQKQQRRKFPSSGDRLIDGLFRMLIDVREKDIVAVYMKKDLRNPVNPKQKVFGILVRDEGRIFLGKDNHKKHNEPILQTLIHEILHQALPTTPHDRINQLETAIWPRFTDNQKRFLRKYIPKHVVKKEP